MSTKPPRKPSVRCAVEWSSEAWAEMRTLSAFERRPVIDAAAKLAVGHRKVVKASMSEILEADVQGGHRLLYRVVDPLPGPVAAGPRVQILCAIVTGATGAAVVWPGARELRRRGAMLRQIGGGIPHEVIRRTWLAEMRREAV